MSAAAAKQTHQQNVHKIDMVFLYIVMLRIGVDMFGRDRGFFKIGSKVCNVRHAPWLQVQLSADVMSRYVKYINCSRYGTLKRSQFI